MMQDNQARDSGVYAPWAVDPLLGHFERFQSSSEYQYSEALYQTQVKYR